MRKKFQALQKDIEEQREQLGNQHEQQKELYLTIKGLEKDIIGLKREIRERDETIGDKERRIYELKKKNQELEKFKFVLDYKIKELKKQIEPREVEINEMKETIRAMDSELERYHKSNAGLDLTIQNLRLKESGLQTEVLAQRGVRADTETLVRKLQSDIADLAGYMQDPKALKDKVKQLYQHYGIDVGPSSPTGAAGKSSVPALPAAGAGTQGSSGDIGNEYARQRNYLEKTIESLKRKLAKDSEAHRADELRIMSQNVTLIKELNELRREIKALKSAQSAAAASGSLRTSGSIARKAGLTSSNSNSSSFRGIAAAPAIPAALSQQQQHQQQQSPQQLPSQQLQQQEVQALGRELDMQRELIAKLRAELDARDVKIKTLTEAAALPRPLSRDKLPPVDEYNSIGGAASAGCTEASSTSNGLGDGSISSRAAMRPSSARSNGSSNSRWQSGQVLSRPASISNHSGDAAATGPGRPSVGVAGDASDRGYAAVSSSNVDEQQETTATGLKPAPWDTATADGLAGDGVAEAEQLGVQ